MAVVVGGRDCPTISNLKLYLAPVGSNFHHQIMHIPIISKMYLSVQKMTQEDFEEESKFKKYGFTLLKT
jgi:hypothetical protein